MLYECFEHDFKGLHHNLTLLPKTSTKVTELPKRYHESFRIIFVFNVYHRLIFEICQINLLHFNDLTSLEEFLIKNVQLLEADGSSSCILLLYSAIFTRTISE